MNARRGLARLTAVLACIVGGLAAASCERATDPTAPQISSRPVNGARPISAVEGDDAIYVEEEIVPESLKEGSLIAALEASLARSSAGSAADRSALMRAAGSSYFLFTVPFAPESQPTANAGPTCDDCVMHNVPLGFTFTYFGNSYSNVEIGSNGFVGFGKSGVDFVKNGCCGGGTIPSGLPVTTGTPNIIALAWTDWNPTLGGTITYETRGVAPNRRFVLEYTGIHEYKTVGLLTAQLVLSEGSSDITMYTMSQSSTSHLVTQGIQDKTGSEAYFMPGRVAAKYTLADDAIRFSTAALAISLPPDISASTDAGLCSASLNVGMATANHEATVGGVRGDGFALGDAYPKGATVIAWTATDGQPASVSGNQSVVVNDNENPQIAAASNVSTDATSAGGASVAVTAPTATDNCAGVSVNGTRSDGADLTALYPGGSTTITWKATDASGNFASTSQFVTVTSADNVAPVLQLPGNMTVDATMPSGAVVNYIATASDNSGFATIGCTPASGTTFAIGTRSVGCMASDATGNHSSGSFNVTVLGAPEQIVNVINYVRVTPLTATQQTTLITYLQKALQRPQTTASICSTLTKAVTAVKGVSTKQLSTDKAARIIADLTRIKAVIGCP